MQKDWVLKVVDDYEMGPSIVDTSFQNGLLKLRWKEYKGLNLRITRSINGCNPPLFPTSWWLPLPISTRLRLPIPNYHGENSTYYVRVNDRYRGSSLQIEGPLPKLSATNNAEGI